MARRLEPDVVLMDLLMPNMDGVTAIGRIKAERPETEIVTMTSFIEEEKVTAALEAGASGYVLKDAEAEEVANAVRAAFAGEVHLDPAVARLLAQRMRAKKTGEDEPVEPLTDREKDVLRLLGQGMSNKEIGARCSSRSGPPGRTSRTSSASSGSRRERRRRSGRSSTSWWTAPSRSAPPVRARPAHGAGAAHRGAARPADSAHAPSGSGHDPVSGATRAGSVHSPVVPSSAGPTGTRRQPSSGARADHTQRTRSLVNCTLERADAGALVVSCRAHEQVTEVRPHRNRHSLLRRPLVTRAGWIISPHARSDARRLSPVSQAVHCRKSAVV